MKSPLLALSLILPVSHALLGQINEEIPSCSDHGIICSTKVYSESVRAGEPLLAEVVCENKSDEAVQLTRPFTNKSGTVWFEIAYPGESEFKSVSTGRSGMGDTVYPRPILIEPGSSMVCKAVLAVGRTDNEQSMQFILPRPGEYQLRARIMHKRGRCFSEPTTFAVKPASEKMERFIRILPHFHNPEKITYDSELGKLFDSLSLLSPSGMGTEKGLQRMREHLGGVEGYQLPLVMEEIRLLLNSRDEQKCEQGLSRLAQLRKDSNIGPFWKDAATEMYAYELARVGRDSEARAVLQELKHESELTRFAKARLARGADGKSRTSSQPARSDAK